MQTRESRERTAGERGRAEAVRRASVPLAGAAFGIGVVGLAGWSLDLPQLTSVVSGLSKMKANTAICLTLGSATVLLLRREPAPAWRRWVGGAAATVVAGITCLTLVEYTTGVDLGLDQMVFVDRDVTQVIPGRMGVNTAASLFCIGVALLLMNAAGKWASIAQTCAVGACGIGCAVIISYPYDAAALTKLVSSTQMALHTAVALVALSLAVLASRPTRPIVAMLSGTGTGALLLRQLWPQALVLLVMLGWLETTGVQLRFYGQGFGTALLVLAAMVVISALVWRAAHQLDALDAARTEADTARQQAQLREHELLDAERQAREEAERANHLKDEFLATLSHELRTPLNAVLGWTHIARRNVRQIDKVEAALGIVERNAQAQARLVDDLLDVSRIIAGRMSLRIERVIPAHVVDLVVASLRPAATAKGLDLDWVDDGRDLFFRGDRDRLQQIVWNLVSNAIKFTAAGGRVTVRVSAAPEARIALTVSDTGEGIPPEFLPFVFSRFRQADGSTTRLHGGLGLGLSIVRHLVELHGGDASASSPGVGRGSTFTVSLPISPVPHRATVGAGYAASARA